MDLPATHYAKSGDVYVAYQIFGSGPIDLVLFLAGSLISISGGTARSLLAGSSGLDNLPG